MTGITLDVIEKIAVLGDADKGYRKELNLVSWNGAEPKIDIRTWSPEGRALKGMTLTEDEARALSKALSDMFEQE